LRTRICVMMYENFVVGEQSWP